MAYDDKLGDRIREILGRTKGITERKMFGGLCFMLDGKMIGGVLKDELVVKIGAENHNKAMANRHVRSFDFTGKPMVDIVYVAPGGLKTKKDLAKWIEMGKAHAASLPKKKKKK